MKAVVFNVQRYCLHDGPGIRTTIFFKGCPLSCLWCHNPESQSAKRQLLYYESRCSGCGRCLGQCEARRRNPENPGQVLVDAGRCAACGKCLDACLQEANEICGRETEVEELFAEVLKDSLFYGREGGMTLSGGEPSMQPQAALALLKLAQEAGINAVIETCGFGKPEFFRQAAELNVTFYYDIKAICAPLHQELTGVSNERILENLRMLMALGARILLRLPLIPGMNDGEEALEALAGFLREHEDGYDHAEIMRYHILGLNKARALARAYEAPLEGATDADVQRWLDRLAAGGAGKVTVS